MLVTPGRLISAVFLKVCHLLYPLHLFKQELVLLSSRVDFRSETGPRRRRFEGETFAYAHAAGIHANLGVIKVGVRVVRVLPHAVHAHFAYVPVVNCDYRFLITLGQQKQLAA